MAAWIAASELAIVILTNALVLRGRKGLPSSDIAGVVFLIWKSSTWFSPRRLGYFP